jgi:hypothetical protein
MNTIKMSGLLVMSLLCMSISLQAQEKNTQSPWTVGLELSTSLQIRTDNNMSPDRSYNHQIVGGKVGYRLLRWFEPWVRLQRHDITAQPNMIWAQDNGDNLGSIVARHYDMDIYSLVFGAAVLVRIGQGDLGLSAGTGISRRAGHLQATEAGGYTATASFSPRYERRGLLQLDYTYWPSPRFGVRLGVSFSNALNTPFFERLELSELVYEGESAFANDNLQASLAPRVSEYMDTWQLGLGVDYRF